MLRRDGFSALLGVCALALASPSSAGDGPPLELDLTYSDRFPATDAFPWGVHLFPIDVKSWLDVTYDDGDETNPDMGDSATVITGSEPNTRAFLHFRVYPGPATDLGDGFFARYGGDFVAPGGGWARARMDTAETSAGVAAGVFATYHHEAEGGVEGSATYKLIPDGVLTPGTAVEYFFSADTGFGTPATLTPDTTGGSYLEFEALPGAFVVGGELRVPCLLYVDAADDDGQVAIEKWGLRQYLGTVIDDRGVRRNGWDRFDHTNAATDLVAPLQRATSADNGMTKFQSLSYEHVLWDTGAHVDEGLRDPDADLLINFLLTDDFDRDNVDKGLWLSGNVMASILQQVDRPDANLLLAGIAEAVLVCRPYLTPGCSVGGEGDSSYCVRLDSVAGADFGRPETYAAAMGNGAPAFESFDVLEPIGDGEGNLAFVDQDAGEGITEFASVSSDNTGAGNPYAVVLDAFSLSRIRRVPEGFTGGTASECGGDSTAITIRTHEVLTFFGVPVDGCRWPEPVGTDEPPAAPPARTVLFQNTPNPFNPLTFVRYDLAEDASVTLTVFDVYGTAVRTLVSARQSADRYTVQWDGTNDDGVAMASGVYWVRLRTSSGFVASTKMVVVK